MRKVFTLLLSVLIVCSGYSQGVSKTLTLATAGSLATTLTAEEKITVTDLTLKGNIDARDFKTMRDAMTVLTNLNLKDVKIVAFQDNALGTQGPAGLYFRTYPADEIPHISFFNVVSQIGKLTLKSVILPTQLTAIGTFAFGGCLNLSGEMPISKNITTIRQNAFSGSGAKFVVVADNPNYSSDKRGVLFNKDSTKLIQAPSTLAGDYSIPYSVTVVDGGAFTNCDKLDGTLEIPASVTRIHNGAFTNCINLDRIIAHRATPLKFDAGAPPFRNFTGSYEIFKNMDLTKTKIEVFADSVELYKNALLWKDFLSIAGVVQRTKTHHVRKTGNLANELAKKEQPEITHLTLIGTIDVRDFKALSELPNLKHINLKKVSIAAYEGSGGTSTATSTYPAHFIPDYAFANKRFESFVFPEYLLGIGESAFAGNGSWKESISLPTMLTTIGVSAFDGCSSLSGSVTIPTGVLAIPSRAFYNTGFSTVNFPATLNSIGDNAFSHSKIETLSLPSTLYNIGKYAFNRCVNLSSSVTIPQGITTINEGVFMNCYNLNSVQFPSTLTSIGTYAFEDTNLESINWPTSLRTIGGSAFESCDQLKGELLLPSTVTEIGTRAFSYTGYTSVVFPPNLTEISSSVFSFSKLSGTLTIPDGITKIGQSAFQHSYNLIGLKLPKNLKEIGNSAFANCINLTGALVIPEGTQSIGDQAFYFDSLLTSVIIPLSVISIGTSAFLGVSDQINVSENNPHFSSAQGVLFNKDKTQLLQFPFKAHTTYTIPTSVTSIGKYAFYNNRQLSGKLIFSENLTEIGDYAFYDCRSLDSINLPASLQKIGNYAFYGCKTLKGGLRFPETLTTIGSYGFAYTSGIDGLISIPASVTHIGQSAFEGCSGMYDIDPANPNYASREGVLFTKDFTALIRFPIVKEGNYTIPTSVKSIRSGAFANCNRFTGNLILHQGIDTIGNSAFSNCTALTGSLLIPSSVVYIGSSAFSGCSGFNGDLTINANIRRIEAYTFQNTSGFSGRLTLPARLRTIDSFAFQNASSLSGDLIIPDSVSHIGRSAFANTAGFKGKLVLPKLLQEILSSAFQNTAFTGELLLPSQLKTVYEAVFFNSTGFTGDLKIPGSVTTIYSSAFEGMTGVSSLALHDKLTYFGSSVFKNWTSLRKISVTTSVPPRLSDQSIFTGVNKAECIVFVPVASIPTYKAATVWSDFANYSGLIPDDIEVHVAIAGGLKSKLTDTQISEGRVMKVTGNLDARDFLLIRDQMINLRKLDLTEANIAAYSGINGPSGDAIYTYAADAIPAHAFFNPASKTGKKSLQDLQLPGSLKSIEQRAFQQVDSLKSQLHLPEGIEKIEPFAFHNALITDTLRLPNGLLNIGMSAFEGASKLTTLYIPASVTHIGEKAFAGDTSLVSIYAMAATPIGLSKSPSVFTGVKKSACSLYIPEGSLKAYKDSAQWKEFLVILEQEFNTSVQSTRIHRFGIYPTTISSGFRISGLEGKATVLIFDINGRKALQQEVTGDEFISTDALPAGSFIVKIVANGIHEQQKLLKL